MNLNNPTPETIEGRCAGVAYPIASKATIKVDSSIGSFLLDKFSRYGLISIDVSNDSKNPSHDIIKNILTGLTSYVNHLIWLLQQYVDFDIAAKQVNEHGTYLKHPNVLEIHKNLEIANRMIDSIQDKHGIQIRKDEIKQHTNDILDRIEALVKDAEKEADHNKLFSERQSELDSIMNDAINQTIATREINETEIARSKRKAREIQNQVSA